MTIKQKLEEYDLYDQAITKHGMLENIRDYELIGFLNGQFDELEIRYVFKGCIKVEFKNIVKPEHFSLDDRLLDMNRQDEPDYPPGFVWGVNHAVVYPGWKLTENSNELTELERKYGFDLYQVDFETNAYRLNLIFHDLETELINRTEKTLSNKH